MMISVRHRIFAIKAPLIINLFDIQIFSLVYLTLLSPILCTACLPNEVRVAPQGMWTVQIYMNTYIMIMCSKAKSTKKAPITKETISESESDQAVEILEPSSMTAATPKKR